MNDKKYILTEVQLEKLLRRSLLLNALECGGVDNWSWYGESIGEFINSWAEENNKDSNEDWDLEDMAREELKFYEELK